MIDPRAMNDTEAIEWRGALVHHSATGPNVTFQQIHDYHVKERGWIDIGYHGGICFVGGRWTFVPGRSLSMKGAHCPGKNGTHLGLCLIGNFMEAPPTTAQMEAAAEVLAEWCVAFDFGPEAIFPHKAYRQTECPGMVDVADLRRRVASIIAHG
jgi:hypothetical protein